MQTDNAYGLLRLEFVIMKILDFQYPPLLFGSNLTLGFPASNQSTRAQSASPSVVESQPSKSTTQQEQATEQSNSTEPAQTQKQPEK